MKNVVAYFHLCRTLACVWIDINKKFHLLLKVHATPMWIGPSWSWYPYSWTFSVFRICGHCWRTMFPSSLWRSKLNNVILIYENLLLSTKNLTIIIAPKKYHSEVHSCHIAPLAQVLPCPQLIFPSKTWFFEIHLSLQEQKLL
jgi:hypothetical protein